MSGSDNEKRWLDGEQVLKQALVALHGERWDFKWTLFVDEIDEGFTMGLPASKRLDPRYPREVEDCWQRIRDAVREGALPVVDSLAGGVRVEPREALRLRHGLAISQVRFLRDDVERWLASFAARRATSQGEFKAERWLRSLVDQHPEAPPHGWRRGDVVDEIMKRFPSSKRGAESVWQRVTRNTKWQQAGRPRKTPARKSPPGH